MRRRITSSTAVREALHKSAAGHSSRCSEQNTASGVHYLTASLTRPSQPHADLCRASLAAQAQTQNGAGMPKENLKRSVG
jgi:hypothetical protein